MLRVILLTIFCIDNNNIEVLLFFGINIVIISTTLNHH